MAKKKRKRVDYDSLPMSIYNPEYQYLVRQNAQANDNVFYPGGELYGNGNGGIDWASMGQQNNGISVSNLGLTNPYSGMNQQNIGIPTGNYTDGLQTEYHRVNPIKYLSMSEPERVRQNELRQEARMARKEARQAENTTDNGSGGGSGVNWGGVIGAAATNVANSITDPNATTAQKVANALGAPEMAKIWSADWDKANAQLKGIQENIAAFNNNNYIQDSNDIHGAGAGLKLNNKPLTLLNTNPQKNLTWKDFRGNMFLKGAKATLQGAASGSVGGPWGALGGAVVGALGSLFGGIGARKRAKKAKKEYDRMVADYNAYGLQQNAKSIMERDLSNKNLLSNGLKQQNISEMANFRAFGGNLYPDGGTIEPYYPESSDPDAVNWLSDWYRQRPNQVQNTFGNNHNLSFVQINPNMNETYYGETNVPKERKVDYNLLTYPTEEEYNKNLYKNLMDRAAASSNILSENMWEGAGGTYSVDGTHFVQNPNFDPHYNDWLMQQWKNGNYVEPEIDKNTPESMINGDNYKNTIMYNWNAMNDRNDSMSTRIHERTHSMVTDPLLNDIDNSLRDSINNRLQLNENIENDAYWDDPNEIYSRMNEFRYKSGLKGSDKVTKEFLNKNRKILEDKGLDRYTDESLLKLFNEIADNNNMSNYNNIAAMGGQFDINLSPNMMSLWSNKQNIDKMKAYNQQQTLGLGNSFNQPKLNTFDAGGDLYGSGYMLDENGNPIPVPKSLSPANLGSIYMLSGTRRKENDGSPNWGDKKTKWYGHDIYTNATPEEKEAFINGARNVVIPYIESLDDLWYERNGLNKDEILKNASLFKEYINNANNDSFDYNGNHYTVDFNDDNARKFYKTLYTIDPRFILEDNGFYETEKDKNGNIVRKVDENGNYIRLPKDKAMPLFGGNVMSSIGSAVVKKGTSEEPFSAYSKYEQNLINNALKEKGLPQYNFSNNPNWSVHTTDDGYSVYSIGDRDDSGHYINGKNLVVGPDNVVYVPKAKKDPVTGEFYYGNTEELIPISDSKAKSWYITSPYYHERNGNAINNRNVSIAWGNGTSLSSALNKAQWPSFYQQTQPVQKAYGGNLNRFDFGGSMSGMDLPTGMQSYENGGTHEENPYGGIQVGVDGQGNPNLVEEGEFRWGDYVFSDRINVDPDILSMYNITGSKPKKKSKKQPSYADMAKKYADKNKELTNDPISKNSLNAYMDKLQKAQEDQKYQEQLQAQQDQQLADYRNALKSPTQNNPMYGSMKYNGMGNANQGTDLGNTAMGGVDNSALSNVNRSGNEMMGQMAAYGGNIFSKGGRPNIQNPLSLLPYTVIPEDIEPTLSYGNFNKNLQHTPQWMPNELNNPFAQQNNTPTAAQKQQLLVNNGYNLGSTGFYNNGVDNVWGKKSQEAWNDFTGNKYGSTQGNQNQTSPNSSKYNYQSGSYKVKESGANQEGLDKYNNEYKPSDGIGVTSEQNGNNFTSPQSPQESRGDVDLKNAEVVSSTPYNRPMYDDSGIWTNLGKDIAPNLMNWANRANWEFDPDWKPEAKLEALGKTAYRERIADHLGDYVAPNLMDVERLNNAAMAQTAANARNILNVSNGRGQAASALAANDYNGQMGIGNNYVTTNQYNADQKQRAADFNRATNEFNATANNEAWRDNLNTWLQGKNMEINALVQANQARNQKAEYKDRVDREAALNRSSDLGAMTDNMINTVVDEARFNRDLNIANQDRSNRYWYDKKKGSMYDAANTDYEDSMRDLMNGKYVDSEAWNQLNALNKEYGFDTRANKDKLRAAENIINQSQERYNNKQDLLKKEKAEVLKNDYNYALNNYNVMRNDPEFMKYMGKALNQGKLGTFSDLYGSDISEQELRKYMDDINRLYSYYNSYGNKPSENTAKAYGGKLKTRKKDYSLSFELNYNI